jgi:hypothetical protein
MGRVGFDLRSFSPWDGYHVLKVWVDGWVEGWVDGRAVCEVYEVWADRWAEGEGKRGVWVCRVFDSIEPEAQRARR